MRGSTPRSREAVIAIIQSRITVDDAGCWLWQGPLTNAGYGRMSWTAFGRKEGGAHRVSYVAHRGPIPAGLQLDHLCRNRACVRPDHLEPVTNRVNILRGESPSARAARATHCVHGHEFTPENTKVKTGVTPEINALATLLLLATVAIVAGVALIRAKRERRTAPRGEPRR